MWTCFGTFLWMLNIFICQLQKVLTNLLIFYQSIEFVTRDLQLITHTTLIRSHISSVCKFIIFFWVMQKHSVLNIFVRLWESLKILQSCKYQCGLYYNQTVLQQLNINNRANVCSIWTIPSSIGQNNSHNLRCLVIVLTWGCLVRPDTFVGRTLLRPNYEPNLADTYVSLYRKLLEYNPYKT